jgi:diguanylate cyclase
MQDLTELGLKRPTEASATVLDDPPSGRVRMPAADLDPSVDKRADTFTVFLDRLMEVLEQLAPESDAGELDTFRTRIREYRQVITDPARRSELGRITDACIAMCRTYLEGSRHYHAEREKELNEVIAILRDAARLSVGNSADFNTQILDSSERLTRIAQLDDIRELRKRIDDEVGNLKRAVAEKQRHDEEAYAKLSSRVEILQKRLTEMEVEASVDPLTKVGNRRRFESALQRLVRAAHESSTSLALAMVDVDHFKLINDTHGHPIGDRVLLCVAQWIVEGVRQNDIVSRYGGEEFAVLLPRASVSEVEGRFRQLVIDIGRSAYEYDVLSHREQVRFTVSCGLADLDPNETAASLVKRADEALYEAKRKGRNRVVTRKRSIIGRVLAWS